MTAIPENIENFNFVVLSVLTRLYESIPTPLNLGEDINIGFDAVPQNVSGEKSFNCATIIEDVIVWLSEENFLRYKSYPSQRRGYFGDVRLTLKGLTILGFVPTSIKEKEPKEPLIQKAKRAISSTASTMGKVGVESVVAEIFRLTLLSGATVSTLMMK